MNTRSTLRHLLLLCGLAIFFAAHASPASAAMPLTGTVWQVVELDGKPVDTAQWPTLQLETADQRVSGYGGVNRFNGSWKLDGDALSFSQVNATRMAGPENAMQTEGRYLQLLSSVSGHRLTDEGLALLAGDRVVVRATPRPSTEVQTASAVEPPPTAETPEMPKFNFRLGAFILSGVKTRIQLSTPSGGEGTPIDYEKELGGDTSLVVFRADATWQFARKHSLDASWYDINLSGRRTLDADIEFGDEIYEISTTVDSEFNTSIYRLAYGYSFYKRGKHEITGLIGAHIIRFQTSLSTPNLGKSEEFDATAPLPSFGFGWRAHWNDRWSTRASIQYFGISLEEGKYSGHFTDLLLAAEYKFWSHGGVGLGYNRFDLVGEFQRDRLNLNVRYAYNGALLYFYAEF